MKVSYNITQNKFNASLNQETTEIKVSFKTGYYPFPSDLDLSNYYTKNETYSKTEVDDIISEIPVVDTSNLVPYTGANKDVNIASNSFKTSKGFELTFDENNYFTSYYGGESCILDFLSKDDGTFGSINVKAKPENFFIIKTNNIGLTSNYFTVTNEETFSLKRFVSDSGFIKTGGTANQALTADGNVFDLTTKADLVNGKIKQEQSQPSTIVMNNSTYVITFTDATGAVQTIDLPLETLFQDANYDETTKSLIVTLQDGTTRTIPLSDLVDLPEIVLATSNPAVTPTSGQKVYFNTSLGKVWFNVSGTWVFGGNLISDTEKTNLSTAYNHSQTTGNPHNTTKVDIGLGNVDNTSDLNKPISNATQLALNGKQNLLTNPVTGTGTANYIPKFTASGTIGNSIVFDNGTDVGIGTTSPAYKLDVNGTFRSTTSVVGDYTSYGFTINEPTTGNFGNARNYIRLHTTSSYRIVSFKIRISSTWKWAAGFGYIDADVSYYFDGTTLHSSSVNVTSATGQALNTIALGDLVIEEGYVSLPVHIINNNSLSIKIEGSPNFDYSLITTSGWSSVTFPGPNIVKVPGSFYVGGNVGIGTTTPSAKLQVGGYLQLDSSSTYMGMLGFNRGVNNGSILNSSYAAHQIHNVQGVLTFETFNSGGSFLSSTVISPTGKVGIGTTSPSEKLEVNGNIKATGFKTPNGSANQALTADGGVFDLNTKANINDIPTKTSFTHNILVSNWTLVLGKYEAVISNAGILANSFVDVIPSNDHVDIVRSAQIYPSVLISEGNVKVYSKFLPSGTISVTVNIN